jgi:hypothetical protein
MVARLAQDADQAAAALRALLEPVPKDTDWYEVHRDMWIRYGDPGDLTAMTENVIEHYRTLGLAAGCSPAAIACWIRTSSVGRVNGLAITSTLASGQPWASPGRP